MRIDPKFVELTADVVRIIRKYVGFAQEKPKGPI